MQYERRSRIPWNFYVLIQILISTHPHPHPTLCLALQEEFTLSLLAKTINGISVLLGERETCLAQLAGIFIIWFLST